MDYDKPLIFTAAQRARYQAYNLWFEDLRHSLEGRKIPNNWQIQVMYDTLPEKCTTSLPQYENAGALGHNEEGTTPPILWLVEISQDQASSLWSTSCIYFAFRPDYCDVILSIDTWKLEEEIPLFDYLFKQILRAFNRVSPIKIFKSAHLRSLKKGGWEQIQHEYSLEQGARLLRELIHFLSDPLPPRCFKTPLLKR